MDSSLNDAFLYLLKDPFFDLSNDSFFRLCKAELEKLQFRAGRGDDLEAHRVASDLLIKHRHRTKKSLKRRIRNIGRTVEDDVQRASLLRQIAGRRAAAQLQHS